MMNVQAIRLRICHLNDEFKNIWNRFWTDKNRQADDQKHVMTEEEMLDEEIKESFPASDPPGHISKSREDRELH